MMDDVVVCPFCSGRIGAAAEECPICHHSLKNKNPRGMLPLRTVLAQRYTVGEFISVDGEGITYHAVENNSGVPVLLKEYLPVTLSEDRDETGALCPKLGSEVQFKTTRMDYAELYRALSRVTPSIGLEAVLDVIEANNTVYAVTENAVGVPLVQYLEARQGSIPTAEACRILDQAITGIAALHSAGLVHRGVSPENIRVLESGKTRLGGYATIGLRTTGSALHPQLYEGYSAPEQYTTAEFEGRYTDVYAVAAVLYRMITGKTPVSAAQRTVVDSLPSARSLQPDVPEYVSALLQKAMALRPADRIQTVAELQRALLSPENAKAVLEQPKKEPATVPDVPEKKDPKANLKTMLAGMLLCIFIFVLLAAWYFLSGQEQPAESDSSSSEAAASSTIAETMPRLVGMTYAQLQKDRDLSDRFLFYITEEYSADVPVGTILTQNPEADALLEQTDGKIQVTLVVSKGPELVPMPNLVGWPQEEAINYLKDLGLNPVVYVMPNDGSLTQSPGHVIRCDAAEGEELPLGTLVNLYVAGTEPTPTPSPEPTATPQPTEAPEEDFD